ncbi:hypothetical protein G6F43_011961 [Rhizopus delemar]|nr:hypothetical protein G6F43_011961 [Rhizopus delemar]
MSHPPKRSHSLAHRNGIHQPALTRSSSLAHRLPQISQQKTNKVESSSPPLLLSPQLSRSSSLLNRSILPPQKVLTRSKSLPQKPLKKVPLIITPPTRTSSLQGGEITQSLLAWKHRSVLKEWNNLFSWSSLWRKGENIFELEDVVKQNEVKRVAGLLWQEDSTFISKKEIASYLGKWDLFHHKVLLVYMSYFELSGMKLEEAFRKLCSKLYFKAEAQEIDRILEAFAYQYWTQNAKDEIYMNADVVYAITYSIMLLNTDLYVIQSSSHAKMSASSFCDNLISTLSELTITIKEEALKERLQDPKESRQHPNHLYIPAIMYTFLLVRVHQDTIALYSIRSRLAFLYFHHASLPHHPPPPKSKYRLFHKSDKEEFIELPKVTLEDVLANEITLNDDQAWIPMYCNKLKVRSNDINDEIILYTSRNYPICLKARSLNEKIKFVNLFHFFLLYSNREQRKMNSMTSLDVYLYQNKGQRQIQFDGMSVDKESAAIVIVGSIQAQLNEVKQYLDMAAVLIEEHEKRVNLIEKLIEYESIGAEYNAITETQDHPLPIWLFTVFTFLLLLVL